MNIINKVIAFIFLTYVFVGCNKDEVLEDNDTVKEGVISNYSEYQDEYGKYHKEIELQDQDGQNSITILLHSQNESSLEKYLNDYSLTLLVNTSDVEEIKMNSSNDYSQKSVRQDSISNLQPEIWVEIITEKFKEEVECYSLEITAKGLKTTNDWITGYPVGYTTQNDFLGVVHRQCSWCNDYEVYCDFNYRNCGTWLICRWYDAFYAWLYPGGGSYWAYLDYGKIKQVTVYQHHYQSGTAYRVVFSRNDFRGSSCTIGSYDGANCYVGTPPSGTSAFLYPNSSGAFYNTPLSGNSCPYPGSWFDGANCFVMDIPSSCEGFIYANNWYVRTNLILK